MWDGAGGGVWSSFCSDTLHNLSKRQSLSHSTCIRTDVAHEKGRVIISSSLFLSWGTEAWCYSVLGLQSKRELVGSLATEPTAPLHGGEVT